ncbi:hypothetical protein ACSBM8_17940 [Sphingomonas sp. ASY06-1R]|jgi:hypothetical protein|uniref:hypothetical protein n=1 Tax=Sphingomonas sp. ASY06-1R TaxID=3445771 RepID=UPI003FA30171
MRVSTILLPTVLLIASATHAATPTKAQSDTTTAAGPKVHTSKSKDITDCGKTQGGIRSVAGLGVGALLGSKAARSPMGMIGGAAAGNAVGDALDRNNRCNPKATVENNAADDAAPRKKKITLKGLLGN